MLINNNTGNTNYTVIIIIVIYYYIHYIQSISFTSQTKNGSTSTYIFIYREVNKRDKGQWFFLSIICIMNMIKII